MTKKVVPGGYFWEQFLIKNRSKVDRTNHQKNDHRKPWNLISKGCQNGIKINAKIGNGKDHENHQTPRFSE